MWGISAVFFYLLPTTIFFMKFLQIKVHSFFSIGIYIFEMVILSLLSKLLLNFASRDKSTQMAFID